MARIDGIAQAGCDFEEFAYLWMEQEHAAIGMWADVLKDKWRLAAHEQGGLL